MAGADLNTLLPQYRGDVYELQRNQAIADALMKQGMSPMGASTGASGNYQVTLAPSGLNMLGQLGSALLGSKLGTSTAQGMNALGQRQFGTLQNMMGGQQSPQLNASDSSGYGGAWTGNSSSGGGDNGSIGQSIRGPVDYALVPERAPVRGFEAEPQQVARQAPQPATGGAVLNPLGMNPTMATMFYLSNPDKFMETQAQVYTPTEFTKLLRQSGIDPNSAIGRQLTQQQIAKQNYIAQETHRGGSYAYNPANGQTTFFPDVPEGHQAVPNGQGGFNIVPTQGGVEALQKVESAKAGGKATGELQQVVEQDVNGNYRTVFKPKSEVINASSTQNQVPNQGFPAGTVVPGQTSTNQIVPGQSDRLSIMQQERQSIANQAPYPNQQADLQAIDREIARIQPQGRSAVLAELPPGVKEEASARATATEQGQVSSMQDSYKGLQQARGNGQNALTMLNDMSNYATSKDPLLANKLYNVQGIFSSDAQLFDKARSNLIQQVSGSTGMGTDSARAIVEQSIPSYGMKADAIQHGLQQIKDQVNLRMVKSDYLSDAYANKNANAYNQRENQFDQMMTPAAASILRMPQGTARTEALKEAVQNPDNRKALNWAIKTGLLR